MLRPHAEQAQLLLNIAADTEAVEAGDSVET